MAYRVGQVYPQKSLLQAVRPEMEALAAELGRA